MSVCTRQLVVQLVSITVCVLSENGICIVCKREYGVSVGGKKRFDENHFINRVHFPLVLSFILGEMHAEKNNNFQADLSCNPVFEIFSCAHNKQETTIHICFLSIADADSF